MELSGFAWNFKTFARNLEASPGICFRLEFPPRNSRPKTRPGHPELTTYIICLILYSELSDVEVHEQTKKAHSIICVRES